MVRLGNVELTVKLALAVVWVPAEEDNEPEVIACVPTVELVTFNAKVQEVPVPIRASEKLKLPAPAVAENEAEWQSDTALGELAIVTPVGKVVLNVVSDSAVSLLLLSMVKVSVEVTPGAIVDGENAAVKVGSPA